MAMKSNKTNKKIMKTKGGKMKSKSNPKKKATKKRLGKAVTLPGPLWGMWLAHVLAHGTCWLYVALLLSHALCLRISEALRLRAEDFSFQAKSVYIGPLKGQAGFRKPMIPEIRKTLLHLQKYVVKRKRSRQQGARGCVQFTDQWRWPATGFLFPSERCDASEVTRTKDTVCKAISRLRKTFEHPTDGSVRSHSGRHTMINTLKLAGLPDQVSMYYARIQDHRTFEGYGQLSQTQASDVLKKNRPLSALLCQAKKTIPGLGAKAKNSAASKTKIQKANAKKKKVKGKRPADRKHGSKTQPLH